MTDARRKTLCNALAIAVLVFGHGGLIVALALAGEWRVWRFITNVVAQIDTLAMVGGMCWISVRHWYLSPGRHDRVAAVAP